MVFWNNVTFWSETSSVSEGLSQFFRSSWKVSSILVIKCGAQSNRSWRWKWVNTKYQLNDCLCHISENFNQIRKVRKKIERFHAHATRPVYKFSDVALRILRLDDRFLLFKWQVLTFVTRNNSNGKTVWVYIDQ